MNIHITPRYRWYNTTVEPVNMISLRPKRKRRKSQAPVPIRIEHAKTRSFFTRKPPKLDVKESPRQRWSLYKTPKTEIKRPNIVSLWFMERKLARENKEDSLIMRKKLKELEKWKKHEEKKLKKKDKSMMRVMPLLKNKSSAYISSVFRKEKKPVIIEKPKKTDARKSKSERFVNCFYKFCCQLYCWCTIIVIVIGLIVYFV